MTEAAQKENQPPALRRGADGESEPASLADLIEWFLTYDERTARMRHPHNEELFRWKQADDEANGIGTYPFENAEARFAIGVFQAASGKRFGAAARVMDERCYGRPAYGEDDKG